MSSCPGSCRGSWRPGFLLVGGGGVVRLVVVVGRHWPLLSGVGRPRDGPAAARSADGKHLDAPCLNLNRRQSAKTMGQPPLQARVCLAVPPLA